MTPPMVAFIFFAIVGLLMASPLIVVFGTITRDAFILWRYVRTPYRPIWDRDVNDARDERARAQRIRLNRGAPL